MIKNYLSPISAVLTEFSLVNELKNQQLDGRRQQIVAALVQELLFVYQSVWNRVLPRPTSTLDYVGISLLCVKSFASGLSLCSSRINPQVLTSVKILESYLDVALDRADELITVVRTVTYVALLVLGNRRTGAIGLAGIVCTVAKRYRCLPVKVDLALSRLSQISNLYFLMTTSSGSSFRVLRVAFSTLKMGKIGLALYDLMNYYVPYLFPALGQHTVNPLKALPRAADPAIAVTSLRFQNENFSVNLSSLHAPALSQFLALDLTSILEKLDPQKLYDDLNIRFRENGIASPSCEETGWGVIKDSLVKGCLAAVIPPNFEKFLLVFKALLYQMATNRTLKKEDFETFISEINGVGVQCPEGWLVAVDGILNPGTRDLTWSVHHHLACFRSDLISAAALSFFRSNSPLVSWVTKIEGGPINTHLQLEVQKAFWVLYRPYHAERAYAFEGVPLFMRSYLYFQSFARFKGSELEDYMQALIYGFGSNLVLGKCLLEIDGHVRDVFSATYTVRTLVEQIYDAIQPQYRRHEKETVAYRKISWDAVSAWIGANAHIAALVLGSEHGYNPHFVAVDDFGQKKLTQNGVRLLLWDLGIIESKTILPERAVERSKQLR